MQILSDENIINAFVKVQRKQEENLMLREKRALFMAGSKLEANADSNPRPAKKFKDKHLERLQIRAQAGAKKSEYHRGVNANMGSAVVVEGQ